ncbi:hypothetical protein OP10G_2931 [Fimbriimonas ginsengisoli Gsoil 348]|uniref:Uncharacterized protein n=1 Tax=Fimbriimonas ginsengisoli Gsoil 348 TaxID=661478 RepID=A0A068NXD8_FIMGI|nr:hypothetical protein OP10G_2931 [Fimbriimonas ginsengisoli Gsoil 348]
MAPSRLAWDVRWWHSKFIHHRELVGGDGHGEPGLMVTNKID